MSADSTLNAGYSQISTALMGKPTVGCFGSESPDTDLERMHIYTCPHCDQPIGLLRRMISPARIRCPSCAGLSRIQSTPSLQWAAGLAFALCLAVFLWAVKRDLTWLLLLATFISFAVGTASQSVGKLVPKPEVTFALVVEVVRSMKWSRSFLIIATVLVMLIVFLYVSASK